MRETILSLDLATITGWCLWDIAKGEPIQAGIIDCSIRTKETKTIPKDPKSLRLKKLEMGLTDIFKYVTRTNKVISQISYEKIIMGSRAGGNTSAVARHLEATLLLWAHEEDWSIIDYSAGTIKKHATGDGSWRTKKEHMISAAKEKWPEFVKFLNQSGQCEIVDSWIQGDLFGESEIVNSRIFDDNVADALHLASLTASNLWD